MAIAITIPMARLMFLDTMTDHMTLANSQILTLPEKLSMQLLNVLYPILISLSVVAELLNPTTLR